MKTLIFPGLSSPNSRKYKDVYGLLIAEARKSFPNTEPEVILWSGQSNVGGRISGEFLVPTASTQASSRLRELHRQEVVIIARSSGCNVAAHCLANNSFDFVRKVVFWGPPPFWLYYDMFIHHAPENYAKAKETGVRIGKQIVSSAIPFESHLADIQCDLLVATGKEDQLCPPSYLRYLKSATEQRKRKLTFAVIDGCPHSVTYSSLGAQLFIAKIFGWLSKSRRTPRYAS